MRRLATALPTAVLTAFALLTLSTGTASAEGSAGSGDTASQSQHEAGHHKAKKAKKAHHKVKAVVTMTGVISDTPTATIGSDTATSTITIAVKGGARELHGKTVVVTLDKNTVVRRGGVVPATAADLVKGDHVSVRARRMPDGSWLALRVNAAPRREE